MGRIHRLSDELINQISAGEVVDRPASVVKELAENAIDAGARQIKVIIEDGGLAAIGVKDDGYGMSREDALFCLTRHATSKLADQEGLSHILTKGFRGEAIPAIASVSRFTLTTSEPNALLGTRITLEGGNAPLIKDAAPIGGTHVEVRDLFFNTPARRKFLKRIATESKHCEEAVTRLALAHPKIGFSFKSNERETINTAVTPHRERIVKLLGSNVAPHLLAIEASRLGLSVSGFVASPECTLSTARCIYTFVNQRYIRDRGLNSAIQRAFQDSLPPGRQPLVVLCIELDASQIDVNVHPQKLEVRFADMNGVQEAVMAAITHALKAAPWREASGIPTDASLHPYYALAVDRFLKRANVAPGAPLEPVPIPVAHEPSFGDTRPQWKPPGYFARLHFLGELGHRFWVCEGLGGALVVLNPQAVVERVQFAQLLKRFTSGELENTAPGLFSATVTLPHDDIQHIVGATLSLARVGIEIEPFGGDTFVLRRVPKELEGANAEAWLVSLAKILPAANAPVDAWHSALTLIARASNITTQGVSHNEVRQWLERLDHVDFILPASSARVVVRETPLLELEEDA